MATKMDTLAFAKRLEDAGMPRRQTEAFAVAVEEVALANLVTKDDLKDAVHTLTVRGFSTAVAIVTILGAIQKLL